MNSVQRHLFTLHELLVMAALAALGGVSSSLISMVRAAAHAVLGFPGGMQFLAGIHVLWPILAAGLVQKPGAATITGLLTGAVELLSGNPHGLLVLIYAALAGVCVDAVWIILGGLDHPLTYMLAGGAGAASNVLVFKYAASLADSPVVLTMLLIMTSAAFLSGVLLAGLLGWWLLRTLRRAGVVGPRRRVALLAGRGRAWAGAGVFIVAIVLIGMALHSPPRRPAVPPTEGVQQDGTPAVVVPVLPSEALSPGEPRP